MRYIFIPAIGLGLQLVLVALQTCFSLLRPFLKAQCAAPLVARGWTLTGARMYCALGSMKISLRFIQANLITLEITLGCLVVWVIANVVADHFAGDD